MGASPFFLTDTRQTHQKGKERKVVGQPESSAAKQAEWGLASRCLSQSRAWPGPQAMVPPIAPLTACVLEAPGRSGPASMPEPQPPASLSTSAHTPTCWHLGASWTHLGMSYLLNHQLKATWSRIGALRCDLQCQWEKAKAMLGQA